MKRFLITFTLCFICFHTFAQLPFQNEIYTDANIVSGDFKYGKLAYNLLRLYVPNNQVRKPLYVLALGSGFKLDAANTPLRNQFDDLARSFAKRGYAVIVMEYARVEDPCSVINNVVGRAAADVHAAIQYAVANKGAWNIDPNYIFVHGMSAGGIASTSAIWLNDNSFQKKFKLSKNSSTLDSTIAYKIKGLALESSGVLGIEVFEQADINQNIPLIMMQAIGDTVVPFNCKPACAGSDITLCGTGGILSSINASGSPKSGTCYSMYAYYSYAHYLENSGVNMRSNIKNIVSTGFAWIIANRPCVQNAVAMYPNRIGNEETNTEATETDEIQFTNNQLSFQLGDEKTGTFHLYDMNGKERKQQQVNSGTLIPTEDLPAGIYIVLLETENGTVKKKIAVQ